MIFRRKHDADFTVIPNSVMRDGQLDFESLGLLCYPLSHRSDWQVNIRQLQERGEVGRNKMQRLVAVLKSAGYRRVPLPVMAC